jgi:hypothetical protein
MRYTVRRIHLGRVARLGCALGWLTALLPAACLAAVGVTVVQRLHQALVQVTPITVSLFEQDLIQIDLLEVLRLRPLAELVAQWAQQPEMTFIYSGLGLILAGGVLFMLTGLLVSAAYNVVAGAGWGLTVELREEPSSTKQLTDQI